jgi:hypothetical protein
MWKWVTVTTKECRQVIVCVCIYIDVFFIFINMILDIALCYSMMSLCIIVLEWYWVRTELQKDWMERRTKSSSLMCSGLSEFECHAFPNTSKFSTEFIIVNHISFLHYLLWKLEVCLLWWALLLAWLCRIKFVEICHKEIGLECLRIGRVMSFCGHGNEPLGFMKGRPYLN